MLPRGDIEMLLCVQELAKDRPSISIVVSMLCSEIAHLPPPKPPAYSERQITIDRVLQEPKLVFSEPSNCYKRPSPVEIRCECVMVSRVNASCLFWTASHGSFF